jgi:Ca2+-binding RTX toxin-like protein
VKRLVLSLLSVLALSAFFAAAAQAGIVASKSGETLTLTSNDGITVDETYTLRDEGGKVFVKTSVGGMSDPDGGGSECGVNGPGDEVFCSHTGTKRVHIVAKSGVDTIVDNRTEGPSTLEGGTGNDVITAGPESDAEMFGEQGEDTLTAAGADDLLWGSGGNDTLRAIGNKAFDQFDQGSEGNDTFIGNPDLADHLNFEEGADTYLLGTHVPTAGESGDPATLQIDGYADSLSYAETAAPVAVSLDGVADDGLPGEGDNVGSDVEIVFGGKGADVLRAGPNAAMLFGLGGGDQVLGGPGPDRLFGGEGSDVIRGGEGDDELDDGDFTIAQPGGPQPPAGNDILDGGGGDDYLLSDRGADDLSGGPGLDRTAFNRPIPQAPSVPTPVLPAPFTVSLDDVANDGQTGTLEGDNVHSDIEIVETGGGDDVVSGGAGPDRISTGAGDDRISSLNQKADVVSCGDGVDTVVADLTGAKGRPGDELSACENVSGTPIPELEGSGGAGGTGAPGGPVTAAPAVDRKKPTVILGGGPAKAAKFAADGKLALTVSCDEPCSVAAKAFDKAAKKTKGGPKPVGSGVLKLGGGKRTLAVTVKKKFRGIARFRVALTVKDAAGNTTAATRTVAVKG